jgi:exodeoxyribonuclease V beta subunit
MTEHMMYRPSHSVALSSSAGSGKTYVLTTRLIAMLLQGTKIAEIVAITFTNLAAKEIRTRLFERVSRIARGEPSETALFASVLGKSEDAVLNSAKKLKTDLIRRFSLIQISTIHSFFASIIDCFPAESGVMNHTVIVDEHTRAQILSEAIERYYRSIEASTEEMKRTVQFMDHFKRSGLRTGKTLQQIFEEVDNKRYVLADLLEKRGSLSVVRNNFAGKRDLFYSEEFSSMVRFLSKTVSDYLRSKGGHKYLEGFRDGLEDFMRSRNIRDLASLTPFEREPHENVGYIETLVTALPSAVSEKFSEALLSVRSALQSYFQSQMQYYVMKWSDLYHRINAIFTEIKTDAGCIDFQDIEEHTLGFFRRLEDFEYLYFRTGSRIRHLLIDEFQDTSELQWDALRHLVRAGLRGNESFFYVGDSKQAIYRWRGGEPELFERVRENLGLERHRLPHSYRQNRVLLDYVNSVFKKIQQNLVPRFHYEEQMLPPGKSGKEHGYVAIIQCKDRETVGEEVVGQIKALQAHGILLEDIAVLCRKNSEIVDLENLFMNTGIPCRTAGKSKLMSDYCAMDVRNIIRFVLNPDEPVYLAGFLRSPVVRLSYEPMLARKDDLRFSLLRDLRPELYEKVKRLTHMAGYFSPSGFIGRVYETLDLMNVYSQKWEVLLNFHELSYAFESTAAAVSIKDFDRYLTERKDSLFLQIGEQHGVSLFTIHASKGLEFHTVIAPFLSQQFRFRLDGSILYSRDPEGMISRYGIANSVYRKYLADVASMDELIESTDENYRVDELNTLYVGVTRARENLILLPAVSSKKGRKNGELRTIGDVLVSVSKKNGDEMGLYRRELGKPVPSVALKVRARSREITPMKVRKTAPSPLKPVSVAPDGRPDGEYAQDPRSQRVGLLKGLVFHRAVEGISELPVSADQIERLLHMAVSAEGADFTPEEREDARALARSALENVVSDHRLRIYFGKGSHSESHVLSLKYRNFVGRIDKIVLGKGVDVLDFKTNRVQGDESIHRFTETYRGQLEGYCETLRDIYPEREVRGWIYFTDAEFDNRLVRLC